MVANLAAMIAGAPAQTPTGPAGPTAEGDTTSVASADARTEFLQTLASLFELSPPPAVSTGEAPTGSGKATAAATAKQDDASDDASSALDPNWLLALPAWLVKAEPAAANATAAGGATGEGGGSVAALGAHDAQSPPAAAILQTPASETPLAAPQPDITGQDALTTEMQAPTSSSQPTPLPPTLLPAASEPQVYAQVNPSSNNALELAKLRAAVLQEQTDDSASDRPQIQSAASSDSTKALPELGVLLAKSKEQSDGDAARLAPLIESFKIKTAEDSKPGSSDTASTPSEASKSIAAATQASSSTVQPDAGALNAANQNHDRLHARVGTEAWKQELGAQLNWMVDNGKHSASLKLSPEHLGPLEVRIDLNNEQASVWFSAPHSDTRTALEQALPRLRELMAASGMSLADAGVFKEPPREQQRTLPAFSSSGSSVETVDDRVDAVASIRNSLLDAYA